MIGQLRGRIAGKRPNQVLVDVGGVGYQVSIPLSTFYALGELHDELSLLIYTHVSQDAIELYGFLSSREKHLFEMLISGKGLGPATAMRILSHISVDDLLDAITKSDLQPLTRIPGVGKKTAERIIFEMRDRLTTRDATELERPAATSRTQLEADAISALLNLGYDRRTSEKAVAEAHKKSVGNTFEALLRAALQTLAAPSKPAG